MIQEPFLYVASSLFCYLRYQYEYHLWYTIKNNTIILLLHKNLWKIYVRSNVHILQCDPSKILTWLPRGYHILLLLSKAGRNLDKEECSGALFNDPSEALECILLNFFNVKLHATQSSSTYTPLHKKWSLPLRIFSITVTKSAVSCGFGHVYWINS